MALVSLAPQHVLVDHQPVQAHGSPRMDPSCANPNLCAESIPKPIRKSRRRIHECPRRIHRPTKDGGGGFVLSDDRVCVMRRMPVDPLDGCLERGDGEDRDGETEIFGNVCSFRSFLDVRRELWVSGERSEGRFVAEESNVCLEQTVSHVQPDRLQERFVNDQRLCRITSSGIVNLKNLVSHPVKS